MTDTTVPVPAFSYDTHISVPTDRRDHLGRTKHRYVKGVTLSIGHGGRLQATARSAAAAKTALAADIVALAGEWSGRPGSRTAR